MRYHLVTLFPELFDSFVATSLLAKAREKKLIEFSLVNPRDFCLDKQRQVDDQIYGWWAWLLIKAQPVIDAIKFIVDQVAVKSSCGVVLLSPSRDYFDQAYAHRFVEKYTDIIFVCGRYEGIDHRVDLWCRSLFWDDFYKLSVGRFVTLGGEVPTMMMIETVARLLPWVINDETSRQDESYRPELGGNNIEYPQYTRPEEVEGMRVPDVLLSWHHAQIEERKMKHQKYSKCNLN